MPAFWRTEISFLFLGSVHLVIKADVAMGLLFSIERRAYSCWQIGPVDETDREAYTRQMTLCRLVDPSLTPFKWSSLVLK